MYRAILFSLTLACCVLAGSANASILPGDIGVHWKANLDGFATLWSDTSDPNNPVWRGGAVMHFSSPMLDRKRIPSGGYATFGGQESLPGPGNKFFSGTLAAIVYGYKVIAVDDFLGPGSYTRYSTYTGISTALNNLGPNDIIYFGGTAAVYVYYDATMPIGTLGAGGTFGTNTAGNPMYSQGGYSIGDDLDEYVLKATFQSIDYEVVDGTAQWMPAGTLFAQIVGGGGVPFYLNVVPGEGTGWPWIMPGVMTNPTSIYLGGTGPWSPVTRYADIIGEADLGAPIGTTGWRTITDPIEWVSQPEPASVVIWAGLAGAALGLAYLRRRAR